MLIKTFAIGLALIGLPLGYLIWYWSQLNRVVRFLIALYLAVMLVLIYPIGSFLWSMIKVEKVFPENCRTALKLSKGYAEKPYSKFGTIIIRSLFGLTPRDYFLSTIGICEYEVADYGSAVVAFEELLKESSSLDDDSRQRVKEALAKARLRLSENEKPKLVGCGEVRTASIASDAPPSSAHPTSCLPDVQESQHERFREIAKAAESGAYVPGTLGGMELPAPRP